HVVRQLRMLAPHLLAQRAHALDREHPRGGRAVPAHPLVEHALDARADRGERPQRVVEVEGDRANGESHRCIVAVDPWPLIPAASPNPPCLRPAPAPASRRPAAARPAAARRSPTASRTPSAPGSGPAETAPCAAPARSASPVGLRWYAAPGRPPQAAAPARVRRR